MLKYSFSIFYDKNNGKSYALLSFNLSNILYMLNINVYTPDCEQYDNYINNYYFVAEKVNEYGAKQNYTEYVNCFEKLSTHIDENKKLKLFYLDLDNELTQDNKQELKQLFMDIDKYIKHKIRCYYKLPILHNNYSMLSDSSDDSDNEMYPTLLELFNKYKYDVSNFNYSSKYELDGDLTKYAIVSSEDGIDDVIIDITKYDKNIKYYCMGSFEFYPMQQLIQLKVITPTWNKYKWDKCYTEEKITKKLYNVLQFKSDKLWNF